MCLCWCRGEIEPREDGSISALYKGKPPKG